MLHELNRIEAWTWLAVAGQSQLSGTERLRDTTESPIDGPSIEELDNEIAVIASGILALDEDMRWLNEAASAPVALPSEGSTPGTMSTEQRDASALVHPDIATSAEDLVFDGLTVEELRSVARILGSVTRVTTNGHASYRQRLRGDPIQWIGALLHIIMS